MIFIPGKMVLHEMVDIYGNSIDVVEFDTINIRNHGTLAAHNGHRTRILSGRNLRVFPGAKLQSTNLLINAVNITVDVMGVLETDWTGYSEGGSSRKIHNLPQIYIVKNNNE